MEKVNSSGRRLNNKGNGVAKSRFGMQGAAKAQYGSAVIGNGIAENGSEAQGHSEESK